MNFMRQRKILLLVGLLLVLFLGVFHETEVRAASNGWTVSNGKTYYKKSGKKVTGLQKIGSYWFYFDSKGVMATSWKTLKGERYYFAQTGGLGQKGRMLTGFQTLGGKVYYFRQNGGKYVQGKMLKGLKEIGSYWFFFHSDGKMATGWRTLKGERFYFAKTGGKGKTGRMLLGWQTLGGKTYYFRQNGGEYVKGNMLTGWRTLRDDNYYFDSAGVLVTGNKTIGGNKFYLRTSGEKWVRGSVYTGWRTVNGAKYFYRTVGEKGEKGMMYCNVKKKISGKMYQFNSNGVAKEVEMTNSEFVAYMGEAARKDMKKTGVLASITVAQAILESGYGKSGLTKNANNLFGMKAGTVWSSAWTGKVYIASTQEHLNGQWVTMKEKFRAYSSWEGSILDHSSYLVKAKKGSSPRYPGISTCRDYKKAAQIIKAGGYATAPNYDTVLCNIIRSWNLTKYDK